MKLLFVDASRNGWGTELHVVSLASALSDSGHSVSVVVKRDSLVAQLLTARGIRTHVTKFRGGVDPRGVLTILRAIHTEQPEWIITNREKLYWTVWVIGRLTRVRVALFRHMPDIRSWLTRCVLPYMVDQFFVVSEYAQRRLVAQGAPADRLAMLYNPIDVYRLHASVVKRVGIRDLFGIAADDFVIGFVGRVELCKGVEVLWNAIVPLMVGVAQIRFLCVGEGAELIRLRRKAQEFGIGSRCHFVSWTPEIGEMYAAMDVLVAPSIEPETFGRVLAEAQACLLPVIGTRMGGMEEAFAPNQSGLLVPANDHQLLQRAISRLHANPNLRLRFSQTGRQYVQTKFAAHKIAAEFIAMITESVSTPSPQLPLQTSFE